jgi:CheY-like chemotaxis protein
VDDEPSIRRLLARTLRDEGFEAVLAANGHEAIGYCRDGSFDALLVDHRMPGMSGTEVYDAVVGARPELAGRVVFMSGDVLNPELGEFAKSKFIALLAKPFDVDALIRVLGEVVGEPAGQPGYV